MKKLEQFFESDFPFSKLSEEGTVEEATLADQYGLIAHVVLHSGVPEPVRKQMDAVKMLWLHGFFYYPFYTLAMFLAFRAVELALRFRFPLPRGTEDKRGLFKLLEKAKKEGLFSEEGFQSLKNAEANYARTHPNEASQPPKISRTERATEHVRSWRNKFAHLSDNWIVTPFIALDSLLLAVDLINQLWKRSESADAE